jgi:DNA polymerase-3 subunit epsilon
MLICGLDFESSGLKIETIGVTEVGIIIWDTVTRSPIRSFSTIVDPGPDVIWEPGALEVNNLTPEICRDLGMPDEEAARRSLRWYGSSDVACAHNGNKFDRPLLEKWAKKYNLDWQPSKVWIDTKTDLELPIGNSKRLIYMAADRGFCNPFPHRAIFDVMTMLKVLDHYDIDKVMEMAKSPNLTVKALITFDQNQAVKNRGYHPNWETKPDGSKGKFLYWSMPIKECKLDAERIAARAAGFEIEVI